MGGSIPGGNFKRGGEGSPGRSLIGKTCPGGSFPDTEENLILRKSNFIFLSIIFI